MDLVVGDEVAMREFNSSLSRANNRSKSATQVPSVLLREVFFRPTPPGGADTVGTDDDDM